MPRKLPYFIVLAIVLGIGSGYLIHIESSTELVTQYANTITLFSEVFLRLIKMILAPLVFSTLVVGIARMGDDSSVIRRIGFKTFGWFLTMSFVSLFLGLVMANYLEVGMNTNIILPEIGSNTTLAKAEFSLANFIRHLFPTSVFHALAENEILQIVVFSLFFGIGAGALGDRASRLVDHIETLSLIMLKITGMVMMVAPLAVFASISSVIAKNGLDVLYTYGKFMLSFYSALGVLWIVLITIGFTILGKSVFRLVGLLKEPILVAFSTATSESAYPLTLRRLEEFGCKNKIASFVLPIGYSFNLDGTMMYCSFAVIFIAQAYGIHMPIDAQIAMLLVLMVTSKGIAAVPRTSMVVIAATLTQFDLPEAGVLLIIAVDHFLDMARSATNVLGNSLATAIVSKWEGELDTQKEKS